MDVLHLSFRAAYCARELRQAWQHRCGKVGAAGCAGGEISCCEVIYCSWQVMTHAADARVDREIPSAAAERRSWIMGTRSGRADSLASP